MRCAGLLPPMLTRKRVTFMRLSSINRCGGRRLLVARSPWHLYARIVVSECIVAVMKRTFRFLPRLLLLFLQHLRRLLSGCRLFSSTHFIFVRFRQSLHDKGLEFVGVFVSIVVCVLEKGTCIALNFIVCYYLMRHLSGKRIHGGCLYAIRKQSSATYFFLLH